MKILSDEERNAHWNEVLKEGLKGCVVGLGVSFGLVTYMKRRHLAAYKTMNTSVRASMWAMPIITMGAFYADEGSVRFDEQQHRSEYLLKQEQERLQRWNQLSTQDQVLTKLNEHKYKVIVGAWAASLYGSWKIVNRDMYMSVAQKAVQARVYAQAITVVLLLGTILLSMHEKKLEAARPPEVPEWRKYLEEHAEKSE